MTRLAALAVAQRRLDGIAEEMGVVLIRSAISPNISDRWDSSTALFARSGRLLAQAAHIPVHLGSMHHAVDAVDAAGCREGEVWAINDPYLGGTHLPDITLVAQVGSGENLCGFVAARAHHADIGAVVPGSMSPLSTTVEEEGVRIPPTRIGSDLSLDLAVTARVVSGMRQPRERTGDLSAQLAALVVGSNRLRQVVAEAGGAAAFAVIGDRLAARNARQLQAALQPFEGASGHGHRTIEMPGGERASVSVEVSVANGSIHVDLRGSDPQNPTSLNCPRAVTDAAVLFAVRSVLAPGLAGASGAVSAVHVMTTPGTVVHAAPPAAVAGGNVEVSSVIVDAVTDALAAFVTVPADGQGTMNNVTFANDAFSYYETLAGGQGGSAHHDGQSGVHVAMTNTRNTPVEVIEQAFPIQVERAAMRRGSGGEGAHRGGDGIVRTYRVLQSCTLSVMSQRRIDPPRGRKGGADGAVGRQSVNGAALPGLAVVELKANDLFEIETPGGGGWGTPLS